MDPEKSDEQVLERSHGVSVLEYEHTIPTRFMVGSEQGMLYFCNRKGKTPMEKITLRVSREFTQFSCDGPRGAFRVFVCYKWLAHSPHLYPSSHLIRNALWPFFLSLLITLSILSLHPSIDLDLAVANVFPFDSRALVLPLSRIWS